MKKILLATAIASLVACGGSGGGGNDIPVPNKVPIAGDIKLVNTSEVVDRKLSSNMI